MYLVLQVSTCLFLFSLQYKLTQFWMFLQTFTQFRINFIFIYLEWQVSTCLVNTLQYMMRIDAIFRQNMKMALKWNWSSCLEIGIGPHGARGQKSNWINAQLILKFSPFSRRGYNRWLCKSKFNKNIGYMGVLISKTCEMRYILAEVFYYVNYVNVNYSVKNSTVDCEYYFICYECPDGFFLTISYIGTFFVLFWFYCKEKIL